MTALELIGASLTVAFAAVFLSVMGFGGWRLLSAVGILSVYLYTVGRVEAVLDAVLGASVADGVGEVAELAVRMVGLGYIFGLVSELLRSLGQSELASGVEMVGRVEIIFISLPYLMKIIEIVTGYINI